MIFHKATRLFLLVPLLLSLIPLTPAQALTTNSVIWCPSTTTVPASNQNGCSPLFSTMALLLGHLSTKDPAVAVTIWMGKDYNSATAGDGNIVFDGAAFTRMPKYPLTIKGGWNGPGKSTIDLNTPSTLDGATLTVMNWKGKVTLKNIRVLLHAFSTAGVCGNAAVCVNTKGSIQLDRVYEENSNNTSISDGALLSNSASLSSPPGSVVVTNSQFLNNFSQGLFIDSKGAVTLQTLAASQSGTGSGVFIANTYDATASPVSVSDGQFNGNGYDGLAIYSNGTVTLTKVYAEDNGNNGVTVHNGYGLGNVLLKGTNTFLGNGSDGLLVYSNGSVTASYLTAYQNSQHGVDIHNQDSPSAKGVAITGGGDFMGNNWGLSVNSKGSVSLNRVNGSSNINYGIILRADGSATLTCSSVYGNATGVLVSASDGTNPLPKLTLQGFFSYGNTIGNTPNENFSATLVTRTNCPYP